MRTIPSVQEYDIRSEGDVLPWLRLMVEDGEVTHYRQLSIDSGGTPDRLMLYWTLPEKGMDDGEPVSPLLGTRQERLPRGNGDRWMGPKVEHLASMIEGWLGAAKRADRPYTDGSTEIGWRLCNLDLYHYRKLFVEPHWQVYGK